jgi:hypothetical protein
MPSFQRQSSMQGCNDADATTGRASRPRGHEVRVEKGSIGQSGSSKAGHPRVEGSDVILVGTVPCRLPMSPG